MSILFRVLSWVGGIVSSIFGLWLSRKMVQKVADAQGAAAATPGVTTGAAQGGEGAEGKSA